jgi:sulfite oxidase
MNASRRFFIELSKLQSGCWRPVSKQLRAPCRRSIGTNGAAKHGPASKRPSSSSSSSSAFPQKGRVTLAAFAGGTTISILIGSHLAPGSKHRDIQQDTPTFNASVDPDTRLPYFRLQDVKSHDASSDRPWVTKGDKVYDITDWVGAHPGGEVILKAAGGSIDPYWNIFTVHKRQDVYDILEQYLVGKIDPQDLVDGKMPQEAIEDPFVTDPKRDPKLRTITAKPCNAETPGSDLADFLTPNETFYVRNHMWVPVVKEPEHHLTIETPDGEEKTYSMDDLKDNFKHYKVTATLQCAGNRRKDMTDHAKQTNGLQWTAGAISSAEWEGVRLRDVLADAGLDVLELPEDAQHAQFMGLEAYGASIPIDKAIDPRGDVILAFKMNGKELPRDHGFPLRVIVPGTVAARSVKWLRKVIISEEESLSQWQRRDYKSFGPNVGDKPDWSKAVSIQEMPITSAITGIDNASKVEGESEKPISVEGYAYSGGGRAIVRVDISTDNGKTWDQAELMDDEAKGSKAWCWKRWRYNVRGAENLGKTTFLVKATDDAYNTQPEHYDSIYNARGNLATAWHRVDFDGAKK